MESPLHGVLVSVRAPTTSTPVETTAHFSILELFNSAAQIKPRRVVELEFRMANGNIVELDLELGQPGQNGRTPVRAHLEVIDPDLRELRGEYAPFAAIVPSLYRRYGITAKALIAELSIKHAGDFLLPVLEAFASGYDSTIKKLASEWDDDAMDCGAEGGVK